MSRMECEKEELKLVEKEFETMRSLLFDKRRHDAMRCNNDGQCGESKGCPIMLFCLRVRG